MGPVRIGVIGLGRIGKLHAENLKAIPGVTVAALADVYIEQHPDPAFRDWAASTGASVITADYRELLARSDVDAVFICSSTDTHVEIIEQAAAAGKHIFCEKPVSFHFHETARAVAAAEQAGVCLQIGFNRRFDHNFQRVRAGVVSDEIGTPHILKITSRDPEIPSSEYIRRSGGLFLDMAIHDYDLARFITGSDVIEVFAQGGALINPVFEELGDVDTAVTVLKFESGAIGLIDNSRRAVYGYDQRVEVFGSKGCVMVDNDYDNSAHVMTADGVYRDTPKHFFLERYRDAYVEEARAFVDAVRGQRPVVVGGRDALQAELIAHAARRSLAEHRPVAIAEMTDSLDLLKRFTAV
ncbi:MAG: inositol 2-dehydrogenase [Alicyclobacillus sp.]|nr:inositol 2-dehydrogenase [Alicyclobacillus sp.]